MTRTVPDPHRPFGRRLTAMGTPLRPDGSLDVDGAARLATYLVDEQGNDALVISGTTGEAPTTSDGEKETPLRAVIEAVGHRAPRGAGARAHRTQPPLALPRPPADHGAARPVPRAPPRTHPA